MNQEFDHFDVAMATELDRVRMFSHPDLPNGIGLIEFSFRGGKVFVAIEDEFDTLLFSRMLPKASLSCTYPFQSPFWDSFVGKSLVGAWQMTNDRGYTDALQMRFRELPNAGSYSVVQMYGEASQITLVETTPVREVSIRASDARIKGQA